MKLKNRTEKKRNEDIKYLTQFTLKELRKRQTLIEQQIKRAYIDKNYLALENLYEMENDLGKAIDLKEFD